MRRLLVAILGTVVGNGPALAADWEPPPPLASPMVATNPFVGGYAALGGSYGISAARSFSVQSAGSTACCSAFPTLSGNASPAGWSGVAAAGYNMIFGPALIGIELDGRWGNEGFDKPATLVNAVSAGSVSGGGQVSHSYSFKSDAGVHLSARLGAAFGSTLIFGKIGAGASRFKETFAANQAGAFVCQSLNFAVSPIGCVAPQFGGIGNYVTERWIPSLIFGVGAEQNFGAFFARGAVEAETVAQDNFSFGAQATAPAWTFSGSSSSLNTQWTVRASAMAGVRF